MCNLYTLEQTVSEVARTFDVLDEAVGSNVGSLVYPGYPGLVIAEGEVRRMTWGFPLALKSAKTGEPLKPKPVNNARSDKLESRFWRDSFLNRRCLIPLTAFAEAEGRKGKKTRTWLSMPDRSTFTCAGVWRESDEWGPVYSMVMTGPSLYTAAVHDRMPVILPPMARAAWTDGKPETALRLCVPYMGELTIDRTKEPWSSR